MSQTKIEDFSYAQKVDVGRGIDEVSVKELTLRKSFSWTFVGNFVYAFFQWCTLSIIAKFFSAEAVGTFGLAIAIATPIFMLTNLQLRMVIATDAREDYSFSHYLTLRVLLTSAGLFTVFVLALILDYPPGTKFLIASIGLMKAIDAISDVYHGYFQVRHRLDVVAKAMMFKSIAGAVVMTAVFYFGRERYLWCDATLTGVILSIVWGLTFLFYELPQAKRLHATLARGGPATTSLRTDFGLAFRRNYLQPSTLRSLVITAAPLGLVMFLSSLTLNVQRYFIEYFMDLGMLGIFVALSYIRVAGNTFVVALAKPVSTSLAGLYAAGDLDAFHRLHRKFVLIGAMVGAVGVIGAAVLGKWGLALLYSSEYAEFNGVFVVLMIGAGLGYVGMTYGVAATAIHAFKEQAKPAVVGLLSTVVLTVALVPPFGLYGAAVATCLVAAINLAMYIFVVRRKIMEDIVAASVG